MMKGEYEFAKSKSVSSREERRGEREMTGRWPIVVSSDVAASIFLL
jgi:hypothetical protein